MTQCKKRIWDGFHNCVCNKTALASGYCGTHDPERRAARKAKRGPTKFERECAAMEAQADLERRTADLLRRLDESDVALGVELRATLRGLLREWEARK